MSRTGKHLQPATAGEASEATRLNWVRCGGCQGWVDDRAPACPHCGEKIYIEHPADITPVRHPPKSSQ